MAVGDVQVDAAEGVAKEIVQRGGRAIAVGVDVGDAGQVQAFVDRDGGRVRAARRDVRQRGDRPLRAVPGARRGAVAPRPARQPHRRVPLLPDRRAPDGQAGWRAHHHHRVHQRLPRGREPRRLQHRQGRRDRADQDHGGGAGPAQHPGERHRARSDRHPAHARLLRRRESPPHGADPDGALRRGGRGRPGRAVPRLRRRQLRHRPHARRGRRLPGRRPVVAGAARGAGDDQALLDPLRGPHRAGAVRPVGHAGRRSPVSQRSG